MRPLRALPYVILAVFEAGVEAQSCYYPNGELATDYTYAPCTGSEHSSCCIPSEGDICLSNGLCFWQGHYNFRGSCTDQSWDSEACPKFCAQHNTGSWERLISCGGTTYCCASNGTSCCSDTELVFDMGATSSVSTESISSVTVTTEIFVTTSNPPSSLTSSTATSAPITSNSPESSSKSGIAIGTLVGIIVGLVLFLLLAAVAACLFWRLHKRNKRNKDNMPSTGPQAGMINMDKASPQETQPPQSYAKTQFSPYQPNDEYTFRDGPAPQYTSTQPVELQSPIESPREKPKVYEMG